MGKRDIYPRPSRDYGRNHRYSSSRKQDYREYKGYRDYKKDYRRRRTRSRSRSFSPRYNYSRSTSVSYSSSYSDVSQKRQSTRSRGGGSHSKEPGKYEEHYDQDRDYQDPVTRSKHYSFKDHKYQQKSYSVEYRTGSSHTASATPDTIQQVSGARGACISGLNKTPQPESPGVCFSPQVLSPPRKKNYNPPSKRVRIDPTTRILSQYQRNLSPPGVLPPRRPTLSSVQLDSQLYPHPWPADFEGELQILYYDLRNYQNEELKIVKEHSRLKYALDNQRLEILKLEGCIDTLNGLYIYEAE